MNIGELRNAIEHYDGEDRLVDSDGDEVTLSFEHSGPGQATVSYTLDEFADLDDDEDDVGQLEPSGEPQDEMEMLRDMDRRRSLSQDV